MEPGTIIIGLVIVAFGALPFVLSARTHKKTEKRLLAYLQTLAAGHSASITEKEVGLQFAIGLSADNGEVYFAKTNAGTETGQCIILHNIKRCRVNTVYRIVGSANGKETVIDRLELVFQAKDPKAPEQALVFFDTADQLQLTDELMLVRKWEERLNAAIASKK